MRVLLHIFIVSPTPVSSECSKHEPKRFPVNLLNYYEEVAPEFDELLRSLTFLLNKNKNNKGSLLNCVSEIMWESVTKIAVSVLLILIGN